MQAKVSSRLQILLCGILLDLMLLFNSIVPFEEFSVSGNGSTKLIFLLSRFKNSLVVTNDIIFIHNVMTADRLKTPLAKNVFHAEIS